MKKLVLFIAASPLFCQLFAQQRLVFCKLKNSAREATFELPVRCVMKTTDGVVHNGTIYRITPDSLICFRGNYYSLTDSCYLTSKEYQHKMWHIEDIRDSIYSDTSIGKMQRQKKYAQYFIDHPNLWADSFTVAFDSVALIRIGYQEGVKRQTRRLAAGLVIAVTTTLFGAKMIRWDLEDSEKINGYYKTWIGFGLMAGGIFYLVHSAYSSFRPGIWRIKAW